MARVAMVSGANRGIGLAVARELKARGHALSLGVRTPAKVPKEIAADALVHRYDAAEAKAGDEWVAATLARFGRIDVVVNNAGISPEVTLERGTDEQLDELLAINVKAPFRVLRAAMPHLRKSGSGRVVNLASLSGKRVLGLNAGYQMAKHAVVALTHAARRAGWDDGVRACAVCPSFVRTDMGSGQPGIDDALITDPADLARLVGTVVDLPNSASVAELIVNWRWEHSV
jgi:NAD(P)-dependent dehydrogenase (short-subunit alcohol dehydrogenase family)